jgi:hypothetical protein
MNISPFSPPPEFELRHEHVCNCTVVPNRVAMLESLGTRDIVAEVGVNKGAFSSEILRITKPRQLHLIDMWGSARYNETVYKAVLERFATEISGGGVMIHRNDSVSAASFFPDHFFDFIYIDTDHSYTITKQELNAYAPKMKNDGVIAGHDYSMGNWNKSYRYGVIEAVHEFCLTHDWEFILLTINTPENQSFALKRIDRKTPQG